MINPISPVSDKPSVVREDPSLPIQYFKGVGPFKADVLKKVGVNTVEDLLYYFPRDHQDRRIVTIRELIPGKKLAVQARVLSVEFNQVGKMLGQARAVLKDRSGTVEALWFKRLSFKYDVFSAIKRDVQPDKTVFVYGAVDVGRNGIQIHIEDHEVVSDGDDPLHTNRIVPVYPLTEGLQDRWLRSILVRVVDHHAGGVVDPLPSSLRAGHQLPDYSEALRHFHFPNNWSERDRARDRLAFDEFFLLELALAINRQEREHNKKGFRHTPRKTLLTPFKNSLGYEFTKAQARAINEIFRDMGRDAPMNRLLQGDVGSGKTVVALSAALLSIENNKQTAFLSPTEILASQHELSIGKFFSQLPVSTAFLTGSTPKPERKKILSGLASGKIQILIGTHAILNEEVAFKDLGLVVIDEQHRFGVRQRARLMMKSEKSHTESLIDRIHPDVLIMTATPIPRTLALTLYGDLDISIINEMPPGRSPVKTAVRTEEEAMAQIDLEVKNGRQAYIVFPLVEESEKISKRAGKTVLAATKEFERLQRRFPDHQLGLLHGQMDADAKKEVMDRFRSGDISILVSTPVIEVGIDVPNTTVVSIMNPERFGLAQLHQLRGRVGRGKFPSECLLVHNPADGELSRRLQIFCAVSDGFRLAEEDLKLRGPGEFIGEAQHGVPFFRVGDLLRDGLLISQAREAAQELVEGRLTLTLKESMTLNRTLQRKFGSKIRLSHVG